MSTGPISLERCYFGSSHPHRRMAGQGSTTDSNNQIAYASGLDGRDANKEVPQTVTIEIPQTVTIK